MAALFNKWFLLSVFPWLTLSQFSPVVSMPEAGTVPHPLHVSVLEINHNSAEKTLEISCRIFTDDFEKVLGQNYKTRIDLINPPDRPAMEKLVKDYVLKHIKIDLDGKTISPNFLGYEKDNDAVYSYFEVTQVPTVKKLVIENLLMHDLFEDQINLMHVTVGGNRKSGKLNYPDKEAVFNF